MRGVVDQQVELAPRPALVRAVESDLPLALAVELHSRRVHRQVERPLARARQLHVEPSRPARQSRVVRGR